MNDPDNFLSRLSDPILGIFWDREGRSISAEQWVILHGDFDYLKIGDWYGEGALKGIHVSTVWLGIDHSFCSDLPIIFETMIFTEDDNHPYSTALTRYHTEEQAREGHARTVYDLELGRTPWFLSE